MNGLDEISVSVVMSQVAGNNQPLSGAALALLHEVETRLADLLASGQPYSIDLRSLPMSETERQILQKELGVGEVSATIEALGPTHITETAVAGVWWIRHRNARDEVVSELIEITHCPEILRSQTGDIETGLAAVRERLQDQGSG